MEANFRIINDWALGFNKLSESVGEKQEDDS